MNLDAAVSLKQQILALIRQRFGPDQRLVAVGITTSTNKKEKGFVPAVRVLSRLLRDLPELVALQQAGRIDLKYIGRVRALSGFTGRKRPLEPGLSVGHHSGLTGTLGCFVSKPGDPAFRGVLSAQHVLANGIGGGPGATEYTLQHGPYDGGMWPTEHVGRVWAAVPIPNPPAHQVSGESTLDCAVAELLPGATATGNTIPGIGPITGLAPALAPYLNRPTPFVAKRGRTTGVTKGVVTAIDMDSLPVGYDDGYSGISVPFSGAFEIEELNGGKFSDRRDSGSLIVDASGLVLGLLFAGSQFGPHSRPVTYGLPIAPILAALGVTIPNG